MLQLSSLAPNDITAAVTQSLQVQLLSIVVSCATDRSLSTQLNSHREPQSETMSAIIP